MRATGSGSRARGKPVHRIPLPAWDPAGIDETETYARRLIVAICSFVGVLCLVFCVTLPGVVHAGARPWLAVLGAGFCGFVVRTLTSSTLTNRVGIAYVLYLSGAVAITAVSLRDQQTAQLVIVGTLVVPVVGAMFLPTRQLFALAGAVTGLSGAATVALGGSGPQVAFRTLAVAALINAPVWVIALLRYQLETAKQRAEQQASRDPLTGLLNRRGMNVAFPALAARAVREGGVISLLLADVDHFKRINDEYGHAFGDEILRAVAHTLRDAVRGESLVVRLGGEEIVVIGVVPDVSGAHDLAERLRRRVEQATNPAVTVSIGVGYENLAGLVPEPVGGQLLESLLHRADECMYAAKAAGRNCVRMPEVAVLPS